MAHFFVILDVNSHQLPKPLISETSVSRGGLCHLEARVKETLKGPPLLSQTICKKKKDVHATLSTQGQ